MLAAAVYTAAFSQALALPQWELPAAAALCQAVELAWPPLLCNACCCHYVNIEANLACVVIGGQK